MLTVKIGYLDLIDVDLSMQTSNIIPFLIVSYFIGLIFQEVSSLPHKKIIYRGNKLLRKSLKVQEDSINYITKQEKRAVYSYVNKKLNIKRNQKKMRLFIIFVNII